MDQGEEKENESTNEEKADQKTEDKSDVKLLNASQAAFEFGITKADIARLREQGKLPGIKGRWGRWYYHPDALSAVILNTSSTPTASTEAPPKQENPTNLQRLISIFNEIGPPPKAAEYDYEPRTAAPLVRLANAILVVVIDSGASDVHLERDWQYLRVRSRIDGIMEEIMKIPAHIVGPLIQRYKLMADINILERGIAQAGNIPLKHNGKDYDLRVSTLPSRHGENLTMHIGDKSAAFLGFNKLGLSALVHARLEELMNYPSGLILLAGPSGSGITTTAYSALFKLNSIEKKIMSLESIPEHNFPGIAQCYYGYGGHYKSSFSETLRLLPLMDVDTLFLGDINTQETLSGAAEAALTGNRVIATMAAENSCMALWRLSQLNMFSDKKLERQQTYSLLPSYQAHLEKAGQPRLQTVLGILSQRLLRKICSNCNETYTAPSDTLTPFGFTTDNLPEELTLFRGKGCDSCRGTGYRGRIGIFELLSMNYEIAALAALHAPLADINEAARANGMREMREDALRKIISGLTTPEEVLRVLGHPKNTR
jgi:type IV pilus assembly protein PilB